MVEQFNWHRLTMMLKKCEEKRIEYLMALDELIGVIREAKGFVFEQMKEIQKELEKKKDEAEEKHKILEEWVGSIDVKGLFGVKSDKNKLDLDKDKLDFDDTIKGGDKDGGS